MRKGWFKIPGVQDGDRTLDQQLKGLERMLLDVKDKRVLELGCAEGLIGLECVKRGAAAVYGADVVAEHIQVANTLDETRKMICTVQNLNDKAGTAQMIGAAAPFDICMMLAILHKLHRPLELVKEVLLHKPELIVIRTAESTPGYVRDTRSDMKRFEFQPLITGAGYELERTTHGSFNEWMGYFRKC